MRLLVIFAVVGLASVMAQEPIVTQASCKLQATSNNHGPVTGVITFTTTGPSSDVSITYSITGLAPGLHTWHVHDWGDIFDDNGLTAGGHFVGTAPLRSGGGEIGDLSYPLSDTSLQINVASSGTATVTSGRTDSFVKLNGVNSIIGRSIVIHGTGTSSAITNPSARAAWCVIGRDAESASTTSSLSNNVKRATCTFQGTSSAIDTIVGSMDFVDRGTHVDVEYYVKGLWANDITENTFHVHTLGNIQATDGSSVGGHFVGQCNNCRSGPGCGGNFGTDANWTQLGGQYNVYPVSEALGFGLFYSKSCTPTTSGVSRCYKYGASNTFQACKIGETCTNGVCGPQEVGNLGNGASMLNVDNVARGQFDDPVIKLSAGMNSIIGRSIIIHDSFNPSTRLAQCVIGIQALADHLPPQDATGTEPQVLSARANIRAVVPSPILYPVTPIQGVINFDYDPNSNWVRVRYLITGLPPGSHPYHVHTYGNLCSDSGSNVGGHFAGDCNQCRSGGEATVGAINNSTALVADANGNAKGQFIDNVLALKGVNSIIGRSIIIHGNGSAGNGAYVAVGVVGRSSEDSSRKQDAPPQIWQASARVMGTYQIGSAANLNYGLVTFTLDSDGVVVVKYNFQNLPPGTHSWHVHQWGDVTSYDNAYSTEGHFVGVPAPNRPTGVDEVGNLNNGKLITADADGNAVGVFRDPYLNLTGPWSIVGRSVVIHGRLNISGVRIAQGVIGTTSTTAGIQPTCPALINENAYVHRVDSAFCVFEPTSAATGITGNMTFTENPTTGAMTVQYTVCGLATGSHNVHVHTYGDIWTPAGTSVGGHFGGCTNCRPGTAEPNNVGYMGNGAAIASTGSGCATGTINDNVMTLNGPYSILGRSVIIHGVTPSVREAQCVIGRNDDAATEDSNPLVAMRPVARKLGCKLQPTSNAANQNAGGFVSFEYVNASLPLTSAVKVNWLLYGVSASASRTFHVHTGGNIGVANGNGVGGHFVGPCARTDAGTVYPNCRSTGLQEVGNIGDGYVIRSTANGIASGYLSDSVLRLNGRAGIIGRSVIVHAPGGAREFQCVIGIVDEGVEPTPSPILDRFGNNLGTVPYVTGATSVISAVSGGSASLTGVVNMVWRPDLNPPAVRVRYVVAGLSASTSYAFDIHDSGNLCVSDGSMIGGEFSGRNANDTADCATPGSVCRPGAAGNKQAIGHVGCYGGNTCTWTTDANGVAQGQFDDPYLAFNGTNSILGRMLIIHPASSETLIAQGVVGRAKERSDVLGLAAPTTIHAGCRLQRTLDAPNNNLEGFVGFTYDYTYQATRVTYYFQNLPGATHTWHVHDWGNVLSKDNGAATGGHFVGDTGDGRPGALNEVGALNDGIPIVASSTMEAFGQFEDSFIDLNGKNSIIGRSIILHGNGTTAGAGLRVAQCVIGRLPGIEESAFPSCPSLPTAPTGAIALLENTKWGGSTLQGVVNFWQLGANKMQVSWVINGLLPSTSYNLYVNQLGDIWKEDGTSSGDIYTGSCASCRSTFSGNCLNKVGCIGASAPATVTSDASGTAVGSVIDAVIQLVGLNSVTGRALVLVRNSQVVAQGVIGRNDDHSLGSIAGQPLVTKAVVKFKNTDFAGAPGGGFMTFEDIGTLDTSTGRSNFAIRFFVWGQPIGPHEFHVHKKGDLAIASGLGVEGHFIGRCNASYPCRPGSDLQEVGRLGDGKYLLTSVAQVARGYLTDNVMTLNGVNDVVGRALIIHAGGLKAAERIAMGVIGIKEETPAPTYSSTAGGVVGLPLVTRASCLLQGTSNVRSGFYISGSVDFELIPGTDNVGVRYVFYGLSPGNHSYHVHSYGNLCLNDGLSTGGHFIGTCSSCRPLGQAQEVGNLNGGTQLVADSNGVAAGYYVDPVIKLYGPNSIIGRSIIVHGNGTDSAIRMGQCVIGKSREHVTAIQADMPTVTEAACRFEPLFSISPPESARLPINGYVTFSYDATLEETTVTYRVQKLPEGSHTWAIHQRGDVIGEDVGNATLGVFQGTVNRAAATLCGSCCAVGCLGDNKPIVATKFGQTGGTFKDSTIRLNGPNSIIGRSLVIMGNGQPGGENVRIAQCVIGVASVSSTASQYCELLTPVTEPVEQEPSSSSNTTEIIIWIAGSVGLLILAVAAAWYLCCKDPIKREMRKKSTPLDKQGDMSSTSKVVTVEMGDVGDETPAATTPGLPDGWEVHEDDQGRTYYYDPVNEKSHWTLPN